MHPIPGRRTDAKDDVRGEQSSEEHDFRSEEQPDAQLRVVKARVLAGVNGVGNLHENGDVEVLFGLVQAG
jgi:hypothetical protein